MHIYIEISFTGLNRTKFCVTYSKECNLNVFIFNLMATSKVSHNVKSEKYLKIAPFLLLFNGYNNYRVATIRNTPHLWSIVKAVVHLHQRCDCVLLGQQYQEGHTFDTSIYFFCLKL